MKTIEDYNFKDKKALIRVDFNVPLNEKHEVTDATRIEAAKPSITKVLEVMKIANNFNKIFLQGESYFIIQIFLQIIK